MNYVNKYLSDVQSVLDEINIIANETNNSKLIRLVEIGNYYSVEILQVYIDFRKDIFECTNIPNLFEEYKK
jgi:hypothetical protein